MTHVSPIHILPIVASWYLLHKEIVKHLPEAVGKNAIHLLHGMIFALHYNYEYELEYAVHISIGFYLYDTMYLLKSLSMMYILHHVITIYLISLVITAPQHGASTLKGYYMLEVSNIMLYVSYHVRKAHPSNIRLIMASELLQLVWYSYYRIFKLTIHLYETSAEVLSTGFGVVVMICAIYAMGLGWVYKLLLKNLNNCAEMKKMMNDKQPMHES